MILEPCRMSQEKPEATNPVNHSKREGLDAREEEEDEIFFGPSTDKEKAKAKKLRRKTELFRPTFREHLDAVENLDDLAVNGDHVENQIEGSSYPQVGANEANGSDDTAFPATDSVCCANPSGKLVQTSPTLQSAMQMLDLSSEETYVEETRVNRNSISLQETTQPEQSPEGVQIQEIGLSSAADVNSLPLQLVPTSPQSEQGGESVSGEIELFSATEEMNSVGSSEIDSSQCTSQGNEMHDPQQPTSVNPKEIDSEMNNEAKRDSSVEKEEDCSVRQEKRDCLPQTPIIGQTASISTPINGTLSSSSTDVNLNRGERRVIYSSPFMIPTNVQAVQYQQPLCYGSSPNSISANTPVEFGRAYGQVAAENIPPHANDMTALQPTHQTNNYADHSAFNRLLICERLQNSPLHATSPSIQSNLQQQFSTSVVYQSPSYVHSSSVNRTHQETLASTMSHKPLYQVHSEMAASSPRVLQVQNGQSSNLSPSVARQQLIEEKRARLAQLRAQKEQLKQRIKQDNEKCFNMKLENARALHTNMAEGMTPLLERLPSQGCNGLAALTLDDRELDILTKLHTIRNSQQIKAQSPFHKIMQSKDHIHLQWNQNLVQDVQELSSPSRPKGVARTILSKKLQHPSSRNTESLHGDQPRARQHLYF